MPYLNSDTSPLAGATGSQVTLKGTVIIEGGKRSVYEHVTGLQPYANSGEGDDLFYGDVSIKVGKKSKVDDVAGLRYHNDGSADVQTDGGADTITGIAFVKTGKKSKATDINGIYQTADTDVETRDAGIITGEGSDTITGMSTIKGKLMKAAWGDGIKNAAIDTGGGDDTVMAIGASVAVAKSSGDPSQQTSEGLDGTKLILGSGEDYVFARGASAGIKDAFIFAGDNNDTLDLHSGTGFVDGGGGDEDRLILAGDSTDYNFETIGPIFRISDGGTTLIDTENVELFTFDNGTFNSGELLV